MEQLKVLVQVELSYNLVIDSNLFPYLYIHSKSYTNLQFILTPNLPSYPL